MKLLGKRRIRNQASFGKYPHFFKPFYQFLFQWEPAAAGSADASEFDTERCEGRLWHSPKLVTSSRQSSFSTAQVEVPK